MCAVCSCRHRCALPMTSALPPLAVTSALAVWARAGERHAITTCAPASHSILAVCSPMPVLQPVTIATCPDKSAVQPIAMPMLRRGGWCTGRCTPLVGESGVGAGGWDRRERGFFFAYKALPCEASRDSARFEVLKKGKKGVTRQKVVREAAPLCHGHLTVRPKP